jgi:site-specific DNA-methyltransferase (adenine-specific)
MGRLQLKDSPHVDKPEWWSTDEWATPQPFIDLLVSRYGRPFDLDPCARAESAKAPRYYTIEDDGLAQPWEGFVWVNPPYSNPKAWVEKALAEVRRPENAGRIWIVLLLPVAIDTAWFHDLILPNADIEFVRGRLRFIGWKGTPIGSPTAGNVLAFLPKGWSTA